MEKKLLEIFKPGTFVAEDGNTYSFSESDVQATIAAYDPAIFKAPLVVGHPKLDSPAYGWVSTLAFSDSKKLVADPEDVDPQFADMVNRKAFPKISSSFFHPDSKSNPVPGTYYLRHVGFLGGAAPAVKGLAMASFAEGGDNEFLTIDFSNPEDLPVDPKDKDKQSVDFAARQTALDTQAQTLAAREKAVAEKESKARTAEIASFADVLVGAGKVLPAEKEGLVSFMAGLNETDTISFADGENNIQKPAGEWLRNFLAAIPARVDFEERGANKDEGAQCVNFTAPAGYTIEPERLKLHNTAVAYQAKHNCDYATALNAVV